MTDKEKALELIVDGDEGEKTIKEYLHLLLKTLWEQEEGFSGKRPFGNSGWQHAFFAALVKGGLVKGAIDSDGYAGELDEEQAEKLILELIDACFE